MSKNSDPDKKQLRRVYGYFCNKTGQVLYVGSSRCALETLEDNHRNAGTKYPEPLTGFRQALQEECKDGTFKDLVVLECTLREIETAEGQLIRAFRPPYNKDLYPEKTSAWRGRYNPQKRDK